MNELLNKTELPTTNKSPFMDELQQLLNRYSCDNNTNTPDFILAMYLNGCLMVYENTVKARDQWYNQQIKG